MYKFFIDSSNIDLKNKQIKMTKENYNHIVNVLRIKENENILLTNKDNLKTYTAKITSIQKGYIICNILEEMESNIEPKIKVDLYQGITKSDKMEYIIQKCTELGINNIIPTKMKFCIGKINDEEKKIERWNKIAEAAAKQSKRDYIPKIEKSIDIEKLIGRLEEYDLSILAYENEDKNTIKDLLKSKEIEEKKINKIALIIGPEGGLDVNEVKKLKENNCYIVSLGKRILRTETAPIAALSMLMYEYDL